MIKSSSGLSSNKPFGVPGGQEIHGGRSGRWNLPDDLEQCLRNCRDLPSLPAVAVQVIELAQDPEAGLDDMAKVISRDPALAAKLLSTANG